MPEKSICFEYEDCLIDREHLQHEYARLQSEVGHIYSSAQQQSSLYETDYAFMELPFDESMYIEVMRVVKEKQLLHPAAIIVLGIGGSNLGVCAVQEALCGVLGNKREGLPIYYADTIDPEYLAELIEVVQNILKLGKPVLLVVTSKSGTTTETAVNFDLFLQLVQTYYPHDFSRYLVIITDFGSALWKVAQDLHAACLTIPNKVGGRFSVLSPVGLFPLAMLGIKIDELLAGARAIINQCVQQNVFENMAALRALIIYIHNKQGAHIHDTFFFSASLKQIGAWYRQLTAESVGKEFDLLGVQVFAGITPTVSLGTVDLHSVAQLYLGGPFDKITTFVSIKKMSSDFILSRGGVASRLIGLSQDKSCNMIYDAILQGVKEAYRKSKRPFMSIVLPEKSAYFLGQLLQMEMIEIVYLGYLLRINPFDQPNVELYKKEARQLL